MASTYSNLKIQLMATGENSTTWGDITNVNIGAALGSAIASSKTITYANASQTLTWTDTNAPQDARFLRLNLTGAATTGYNLVVPAIGDGKPYIVNNGTDGTITIKNATGTGIAVPTGKTMWVYNDGTNVVDAITHLTSLTLGTALSATSGGTGQSSYAVGDLLYASTTTALSKLADVATGNSLISGGVGVAPSWGKVGLTTHVSGTLPVANGGTGAATLTGYVKGTGTTAMTAAATIPTSDLSGTVAATNGGTGQTVYAVGDLLYASTTTALSKLADVATGNALISGGVGVAPSWGKIGLTTHVSGTLGLANGGTNGTDAATARTGIGATTVGGNFFTLTNPSAITFPRINADNTVSALDAASFRTAIGAGSGGGSVTSVSFTGGIVSVATATTTPALTVAGTSGGIPYFSSGTTWASSAALAANALVVGGGAGAAPATVTTGTSVVTALGVAVGSAGAVVVNGGALGTPSSGALTNCTADGTNAVGFKKVPQSGSDKTTSYSLVTGDVGKFIGVGTGGSITIPDATFATGDIISLFNNTTGNITITCTITTAYIGGVDVDKATMTLATRGVATVLFISGTVCVVNGNVS